MQSVDLQVAYLKYIQSKIFCVYELFQLSVANQELGLTVYFFSNFISKTTMIFDINGSYL